MVSYLSRDVPLQLLGPREVGMGLPTAVALLCVAQPGVHGEHMLEQREEGFEPEPDTEPGG